MSDPRCPRCGAVRRPGDQWCGLCYADFREAPPAVVGDATPPPAAAAPVVPAPDAPPLISRPDQPVLPPSPTAAAAAPAPSAAIPAQPAPPAPPAPAASSFVPSTNPLAPTVTAPAAPPQATTPSAPAAAGTPTEAATNGGDPAAELKWPCTGCGAMVPMSEDYCPACGTGFLAPVAGTSVAKKVPLIGDVTKMNSGQKLVLGIAIASGVILGMLALLFIGGSLFG